MLQKFGVKIILTLLFGIGKKRKLTLSCALKVRMWEQNNEGCGSVMCPTTELALGM